MEQKSGMAAHVKLLDPDAPVGTYQPLSIDAKHPDPNDYSGDAYTEIKAFLGAGVELWARESNAVLGIPTDNEMTGWQGLRMHAKPPLSILQTQPLRSRKPLCSPPTHVRNKKLSAAEGKRNRRTEAGAETTV